MSTRPVMSCESCRDLLIELVCDELPTDTAAETRAHALTCERCGAELAKLEGTLRVASELPLLTPSPEVERRIMQAARAAISGKAKGPARERQVSEGDVASWFARVSAWAMSPQVAMASVLILVVGIGLYALPIGQAPETSALRATDDEAEGPGDQPASAPSAVGAATPMPEPEEQAEQRRERSAGSAAELLRETPAPRPQADMAPVGKGAPVARSAKPKAAAKSGAYDLDESQNSYGGSKLDDKSRRAAEVSAPLPGNARLEAKQSKPESASDDNVSGAGRANFAPAPPASPAPIAEPVASQAQAPKKATSGQSAPAALEGEVSKESTQQLGSLAQGIAASQRGDYGQAEKLLGPVAKGGAGTERAQANLWLARSYRAQGDCVRALSYYRTLTQAVSVSRDVLEEAADCYGRVGNEQQASRLRARVQLPAAQKTRQ